jgi:membrane fusion protein (multidrug efflux system)
MAEPQMPPDRGAGKPPPGLAAVVSSPAARGDAPPLRRLRRPREIFLRLSILAAAGVIVGLFATQWDRWVGMNTRQVTDDAYVRGDITPLSAKVEGYVHRVAVDDFDRVKAGDPLVEIDDSDYQARVAQAEADLLGAEAAIENLKSRKALQHSQVTEAENSIAATQADVERTRQEAARQRALLATTYGTQQRVEQANADERRFSATLANAGNWPCSIRRNCNCAPTPRRNRRRSIWRRSTSAIHVSQRR